MILFLCSIVNLRLFLLKLFTQHYNFMKTSIYALVISILITSSTVLFAESHDSSNFNIKITIKESCNISSKTTSDLDFGTVERSSPEVSTQGKLNVTCTQGTPYNISLKSKRLMTTQTTQMTIPYQIYQDSTQQVIWGSDVNNAYTNTGTGTTQNIPIWSKVTAEHTNVPAGNYSDTVTAVINY